MGGGVDIFSWPYLIKEYSSGRSSYTSAIPLQGSGIDFRVSSYGQLTKHETNTNGVRPLKKSLYRNDRNKGTECHWQESPVKRIGVLVNFILQSISVALKTTRESLVSCHIFCDNARWPFPAVFFFVLLSASKFSNSTDRKFILHLVPKELKKGGVIYELQMSQLWGPYSLYNHGQLRVYETCALIVNTWRVTVIS